MPTVQTQNTFVNSDVEAIVFKFQVPNVHHKPWEKERGRQRSVEKAEMGEQDTRHLWTIMIPSRHALDHNG